MAKIIVNKTEMSGSHYFQDNTLSAGMGDPIRTRSFNCQRVINTNINLRTVLSVSLLISLVRVSYHIFVLSRAFLELQQEPMTWSLQLHCIYETAFLQTKLFIV